MEFQNEYESEEEEQQPKEVSLPTKDLRALRKAAKERDELQKRMADMERQIAFRDAKLDLDDPKIRYFMKGYEGDFTAEAIRAQAETDGFLTPADKAANQQRQQEAQDNAGAQQRIVNASAGAGETSSVDLADAIKKAASPEEVMAIMAQAGYPTSWTRGE